MAPSAARRSAMPKPMPCAPPGDHRDAILQSLFRCSCQSSSTAPLGFMRQATMIASRMVISSTTVTRALISGVKPTRIIAHRRSGSVIWSPATKVLIRVSSKDKREREHGAGHHGGCQMRHQHIAQGLPAAGAQIEGGLDQ